MNPDKLPKGLVPKGSSRTFTKDTLPDALCTEHALAKNRWGALHILEGSVVYVDLVSNDEREIAAPHVVLIEPERPHKLRLSDGPLRCRVDFYAPAPDTPDLDSPQKIAELVRAFYERVREDDLLGPVFVDQARVNWEEHLPKLTAFWCKLELGIPGFNGAPTQKHAALSRVAPFRAEQFARWVALFHETVDERWSGPHARSIKERAKSIAKVQSKIVAGAEPWAGE